MLGAPSDRALAVIQANLADVGIQVDVGTSDWGTFYPSLLKPDWDMDLNRWTWSDPSVLSQLFRSPGHRKLLPVLTDKDIHDVTAYLVTLK